MDGMRYEEMYEGYLESWQVGCAVRCMLEQEVPEHEWDDILQDVAPRIREEAAPFGGSPATRVFHLVKARIRAGRKREQNYRKHVQTLPDREECKRLENGLLAPDETRGVDMRYDIKHALASLSARERALCHHWGEGLTREEIAGAMGIEWHTVARMQDTIRRQFSRLALTA